MKMTNATHQFTSCVYVGVIFFFWWQFNLKLHFSSEAGDPFFIPQLETMTQITSIRFSESLDVSNTICALITCRDMFLKGSSPFFFFPIPCLSLAFGSLKWHLGYVLNIQEAFICKLHNTIHQCSTFCYDVTDTPPIPMWQKLWFCLIHINTQIIHPELQM